MKLLNYNELKTLLLEERDKIPLTVPGARYEMNIPQPNKHGESMRGGIRIALRCMERCQPITLDDLRPTGRWLTWSEKFPKHNVEHGVSLGVFCSLCELHADNISGFCPNCGADMRGGGEDG